MELKMRFININWIPTVDGKITLFIMYWKDLYKRYWPEEYRIFTKKIG